MQLLLLLLLRCVAVEPRFLLSTTGGMIARRRLLASVHGMIVGWKARLNAPNASNGANPTKSIHPTLDSCTFICAARVAHGWCQIRKKTKYTRTANCSHPRRKRKGMTGMTAWRLVEKQPHQLRLKYQVFAIWVRGRPQRYNWYKKYRGNAANTCC